jgi:hypothetical protein
MSLGLVLIFYRFETLPHPPDKNYFDRYYAYLGHGLSDFILSLLKNPFLVVSTVGQGELARYFWRVFSPWLFLPLLLPVIYYFRKKGLPGEIRHRLQTPWILAILPSFLSAALATYPPLRGVHFHYVLELWPILAVTTLIALVVWRSPGLVWGWAFFSLLSWGHDPVGDFRHYLKSAAIIAPLRSEILKIPADSAVTSDELTGTWLAGRAWATRWPDTRLLPDQCPDYIIVKFSENGTLTELSVQTLTSQCTSRSGLAIHNSDMIVPKPIWREGDWSIYRVGPSRPNS